MDDLTKIIGKFLYEMQDARPERRVLAEFTGEQLKAMGWYSEQEEKMEHSKMIEGSVSKRMGHVSTVHFRIEASVDGNEKVFSVHTFDGLSYNMDIDDVIDVIFQAYRKAAKMDEV